MQTRSFPCLPSPPRETRHSHIPCTSLDMATSSTTSPPASPPASLPVSSIIIHHPSRDPHLFKYILPPATATMALFGFLNEVIPGQPSFMPNMVPDMTNKVLPRCPDSNPLSSSICHLQVLTVPRSASLPTSTPLQATTSPAFYTPTTPPSGPPPPTPHPPRSSSKT